MHDDWRHHAASTQSQHREPGTRGGGRPDHARNREHPMCSPFGTLAGCHSVERGKCGRDVPQTEHQRRQRDRTDVGAIAARECEVCTAEQHLFRERGFEGDAQEQLVGHLSFAAIDGAVVAQRASGARRAKASGNHRGHREGRDGSDTRAGREAVDFQPELLRAEPGRARTNDRGRRGREVCSESRRGLAPSVRDRVVAEQREPGCELSS